MQKSLAQPAAKTATLRATAISSASAWVIWWSWLHPMFTMLSTSSGVSLICPFCRKGGSIWCLHPLRSSMVSCKSWCTARMWIALSVQQMQGSAVRWLKRKKRPHHVEKQLTNNSCWKGNWKTTSFNRDNGKLKISEVEQTALYLQSLQIESCLLLAIRFSDTDSWCPCILVLGYSIFSWLFRNCVYSSKKSITDAL